MSTTIVKSPTSLLRFGIARADVTPPVGIYHRLWGAARHDRATGVHRPLTCEVMVMQPANGSSRRIVRAQFDLAGLVHAQHADLTNALSEATGAAPEDVVISYSHTHSSGWFVPDRLTLPGGEKIPGYLKQLNAAVADAGRRAAASMTDAVITYGVGRCNMAANRDYWDEKFGGYTCGYNPDAPADDTLIVGRVTDLGGRLIALLVNYACHGTTLAWENTLISPDFVGALREEVERLAGGVCVYLQGACGDLGPRDGFTGDVAVADRNGRQVAYAALSTLQAIDPPLTDFVYQGPVISGATLGTWAHVPFTPERRQAAARFAGGSHTVALPLKPRPDPEKLKQEMADWEARQREADARGEKVLARDYGARAERARRWLGRLQDLPAGNTYPYPFWVYRLGDAVWVAGAGEPYNIIQRELRQRFPELTILFSPLSAALQIAYLLPRDRYGRGLYQEEPSILGPGCLEQATEAMSAEIAKLR